MSDSHRLVATYSKIKGHLEEYEVGLCGGITTPNHFT